VALCLGMGESGPDLADEAPMTTPEVPETFKRVGLSYSWKSMARRNSLEVPYRLLLYHPVLKCYQGETRCGSLAALAAKEKRIGLVWTLQVLIGQWSKKTVLPEGAQPYRLGRTGRFGRWHRHLF